MPTLNSQFYVVGGTVSPDSPSYVVRKADQELYDRLLAGEFCYVLTSRQMGKSSLMARTARRLTNEAHIHAAIVDLTQIGTERDKLSSEQWYYGIAHRVIRELKGRELKLRDVNLSEWWQSRSQLPALQRLTEFFRDLLLEKIEGQIVVFIDEIDSTILLPFTDDFFAAIRACHNARATDATYNRLSFVLLGVASPSDLVKDATRTPFNVGQRIELTDFTAEEARPLAAGLSANGQDGEQILARILEWTGGHPYLTQKLCGAVQSSDSDSAIENQVDLLVEQDFLSQSAINQEPNLCFIRDRLTKDRKLSDEAMVATLKLYISLLSGGVITDAPLSIEQTRLKLSGVVKLNGEGRLQIRNKIYEQAFTKGWATEITSFKTIEYKEKKRRRLYIGLTIIASVVSLIGIYNFLIASEFGTPKEIEIGTAALYVRGGPGGQFKPYGIIASGTRHRIILEGDNGWLEIEVSSWMKLESDAPIDVRTGWVYGKSDYVRVVRSWW